MELLFYSFVGFILLALLLYFLMKTQRNNRSQKEIIKKHSRDIEYIRNDR